MIKSENIIKLNISIRRIKKAAKSLKIHIYSQKIENKKEDYIIVNVTGIILFFHVFYIYILIFIF